MSACTDVLGLHTVVGAVFAGFLLRRHVVACERAFGSIATFVLVPFFFINMGRQVAFDVADAGVWWLLLATVACAVLGKGLAIALPALRAGFAPREALALGALVQTKGVMEIVIASVLRDAGLISPTVFSALIVLSLISTLLTRPLLGAFGVIKVAREAFFTPGR